MNCALALAIVLNNHYSVPNQKAKLIAKYTCKYADQYQIDPALAAAVMWNETRFRNSKRNRTHDYGIMQIHCPSRRYAPWCAHRNRLHILQKNIKTGIFIMHLFKRSCVGKHTHKSHWIRHYNWYGKAYRGPIFKIRDRIKRRMHATL